MVGVNEKLVIICALSVISIERAAARRLSTSGSGSKSRTRSLEKALDRILKTPDFSIINDNTSFSSNNEDPRVSLNAVHQKSRKTSIPSLDLDDKDYWINHENWWKDPFALFDDEKEDDDTSRSSTIDALRTNPSEYDRFGSNDYKIDARELDDADSTLSASLRPSSELTNNIVTEGYDTEENIVPVDFSVPEDSVIDNEIIIPKESLNQQSIKNKLINYKSDMSLDSVRASLGPFMPPLFTVMAIAAFSKTILHVIRKHLELAKRLSRFLIKRETNRNASIPSGDVANKNTISKQLESWKQRCLRAERDLFVIQNECAASQAEVSVLKKKLQDLKIENRYMKSIYRDQKTILSRTIAACRRDAARDKERLKAAMLKITENELNVMREEVELQAAELKKRILA